MNRMEGERGEGARGASKTPDSFSEECNDVSARRPAGGSVRAVECAAGPSVGPNRAFLDRLAVRKLPH